MPTCADRAFPGQFSSRARNWAGRGGGGAGVWYAAGRGYDMG